MALQSIGSTIIWPQPRWSGNSFSINTFATLDAAGEYVAYIAVASQAMTISHVGFRPGAVAGSPTVDVRIETVGADGMPSGTLWDTNTNATSATLSATTWALTALTAPATIAAGQAYCVKIAFNAGTSVVIQRLNNGAAAGTGDLALPYHVVNVGTPTKSAITATSFPILAVGSSSTVFYRLSAALPYLTDADTTIDNSAGARRGARFQVPFSCRVAGVFYGGCTNATGDYDAVLYNDAGTELSSSGTSFDGDHNAGSSAAARLLFFDNPVTLSPSTWYRVAIVPTSATAVQLSHLQMPSADYMTALPGGPNFFLTTYTTAGGWVDTATDTVPALGLLIDQLDDGVASAAVGYATMSGGLQ